MELLDYIAFFHYNKGDRVDIMRLVLEDGMWLPNERELIKHSTI